MMKDKGKREDSGKKKSLHFLKKSDATLFSPLHDVSIYL